MRSWPHCCRTTSATASGTCEGSAPRSAVEVHDALGEGEPAAGGGDRVGGVERRRARGEVVRRAHGRLLLAGSGCAAHRLTAALDDRVGARPRPGVRPRRRDLQCDTPPATRGSGGPSSWAASTPRGWRRARSTRSSGRRSPRGRTSTPSTPPRWRAWRPRSCSPRTCAGSARCPLTPPARPSSGSAARARSSRSTRTPSPRSLDGATEVGAACGAADAGTARGGRSRPGSTPSPLLSWHGRTARVLVLEWTDPPFVAGHWVPDLVTEAGGVPVLARAGERSVAASWDDVRSAVRSADAVLVAPCGYGLPDAVAQAQAVVDVLGTDLPAGCAVHAVDAGGFVTRPGPRVVDAVEALAAAWHPAAASAAGVTQRAPASWPPSAPPRLDPRAHRPRHRGARTAGRRPRAPGGARRGGAGRPPPCAARRARRRRRARHPRRASRPRSASCCACSTCSIRSARGWPTGCRPTVRARG